VLRQQHRQQWLLMLRLLALAVLRQQWLLMLRLLALAEAVLPMPVFNNSPCLTFKRAILSCTIHLDKKNKFNAHLLGLAVMAT